MKLKRINLPAVERFACTPRQIKAVFDGEALAWVSFGNPIRTFSFDSRARRVPKLSGAVAASMSMTRQGEAYLCMYPVRRESYSDVAADDFVESVLHGLADWLARMHARPATGVVGMEQVIVEWTGEAHVIHKLTVL